MTENQLRRLTAHEAAEALGVSKATLYAYTSRGQLRSEPAPGQPRERRYFREDVDRLRERKEARRDPAKAAARGLHWGSPVLESGITLIQDGKLYYRGRDVLNLARHRTLEEVAELLWNSDPGEQGRLFEQPPVLSPGRLVCLRSIPKDGPLSQMQMALPLGGAVDLASYDLRPEAVRLTGARIVRLLTTVIAGRHSDLPIHRAMQAVWAPKKPAASEAIRTALVLCADHELNVSTFVARCAASAGASPYDVVSAALAALKGHRHGGATERLSALFVEVGTPERSRAVVSNRLRRGENLPGFGHPLYAAGDPRALLLLKTAEAAGNTKASRLVRHLAKAGSDLLQARPNLDFGLVAMTRAYGLPDHAPLVLFALGRTVGWIAHAIEQYASSDLIRPRARYTGPPPEPVALG
jgi:citrate synthase